LKEKWELFARFAIRQFRYALYQDFIIHSLFSWEKPKVTKTTRGGKTGPGFENFIGAFDFDDEGDDEIFSDLQSK
jgi:hypothetical protein